jgi:hypothetical protein
MDQESYMYNIDFIKDRLHFARSSIMNQAWYGAGYCEVMGTIRRHIVYQVDHIILQLTTIH